MFVSDDSFLINIIRILLWLLFRNFWYDRFDYVLFLMEFWDEMCSCDIIVVGYMKCI